MKSVVVWLAMAASLFLATSAGAKPEYLDTLIETYKPYSAALTERSCSNCHTEDPSFTVNSYGLEIHQLLKPSGNKPLTADVLHQIEPMDADLDGVSNLDEIKGGSAPADPKSTSTPGATAGAAPGAPSAPATPSFIPKNGFHPAVVHFPIALFLAGLILDFFGMIRKDKTLLFAGWYNLVLAALSAAAAIVAGYLAVLLQKMPFSGIIREHIILALAGTIIMWILVALRVHRHESMSKPIRFVYYALALAGMLLISYSGHLGGEYVYGK